jgi:hypothetical protein
LYSFFRQQSPQVSYAKAIDIWMGACIFFTFLSLFEFTFMSWLEHVKEREEKRKKEHEEEVKLIKMQCYDFDNFAKKYHSQFYSNFR